MARKLQLRKYYTHKNYGGIWMLASCDWNNLKLINVENGMRWGQDVYDPAEFDEIFIDITISGG
jgi:hypothetical protein